MTAIITKLIFFRQVNKFKFKVENNSRLAFTGVHSCHAGSLIRIENARQTPVAIGTQQVYRRRKISFGKILTVFR